MKEIAQAFLKAQSEMSNPIKGSANPFFKSKYADLNSVREAVIPTLNAHGIMVLQPMVSIDGKNYIKTMLLHESGETIEGLTEIIYAKQNDAQAQGSGITYARRYGLQSLVCVGADDDDGNAASQPQKKQSEPKQPEQKPVVAANDLEAAIRQTNKAETLQDLAKIWSDYKVFQGDIKFQEAKETRKKELTPNA